MIRISDAVAFASRRAWHWRNRSRPIARAASEKPRLLVDVSTILRHDAQTGIQRVVRAVWCELQRRSGEEFEAVPVYATKASGYCYAPIDFLDGNQRELDKKPVHTGPGDKFLGLDLSARLLPMHREQLSAWRASGTTVHVVVYDLLPLTRPDWFEPATTRYFKSWFDTIVEIADQALCISDSVARGLQQRIIGTSAERRLGVGRLHLSGDIAGSKPSVGFSHAAAAALEQAKHRGPVLMIGTVEPRKGYDRALDAFDVLWSRYAEAAPDLVIIGKRGWKTAELQRRIRTHPEIRRRLHWLEDVSDEALTQFYDASAAVLATSFDEGFGLPVIEAATHGRWVLARDIPVFREQRLANLRYFTDDAGPALALEILGLLRAADAGPPSPLALPSWADCVGHLVSEMGLASPARGQVIPFRKAS